MNNQRLIFISAYCQNTYQEDRIRNFARNQDVDIVNPSFNVRDLSKRKSSSLDSRLNEISQKEVSLISKSDEVWLLIGSLDSNLPENKIKMHRIEESSIELNKPIKYIHISQTGRYVGNTRSIARRDIFDGYFYAFLRRSKKDE
jgi:hypothetical protein